VSTASQPILQNTTIIDSVVPNCHIPKAHLLFIFLIVIALGLRKPREERLSRFADLLAGRDVDVFFAGFGAPLEDYVFGEEIFVVENEEDLGGLIEELGVFLAAEADETLDASEEGLLMLLGGTNL
jgi:hypothetical protein